MRRAVVVGTVAIAVGAFPASTLAATTPAFRSGNTLWADCNNQTNQYFVANCYGYITGIADALAAQAKISGVTACFRPGVSEIQLRDIVLAFLRANPALRDSVAAPLVADALRRAFPCP